ncbi:MAG: FKBP-type peptidyl-prolyl cis-trans isomerase, partial [Pseudomonadota bacterium]
MKIGKGRRVRMDYELRIEGGEVLESSAQKGPLEYVHGTGKMLSGLESRIEGLSAGDEKEGVIPANEAYGAIEDLPAKD